jgi:ABC-type oligopeptide transport system substrate-binding subunit
MNAAYASQGIAQYGKPKYADGFAHFDYVNPNAPRGGTLTLPNPGLNLTALSMRLALPHERLLPVTF